jgi:hypothetical protein
MQPLAPEREARARRGWLDFVHLQTEVHPDRPATFYDVVRIGSLQMGVGSALETKFLFRIRGPSDAPNDDLVVEARTTSPPTGKECAARPVHGGAIQPLMFMTILGPRLPEVNGYASLADDSSPEFWVQSWVPGYRELSIKDLENETELKEVVVDAARQLAGHFWSRFPEEIRSVQRHAQLRAFDMTADRARQVAKDFAAETTREWEKFKTPR